MKITVLGTGCFGSAIAQIMTDNKNEVLLWTNDLEQIEEINTNKSNKKYYPDFRFCQNVKATDNLNDALNFSDIIIIALPSKIIKEVSKKINKCHINKKIFINMSKGIDYKDLTTISETLHKNIDGNLVKNIYTMTGPTFAKEIIERKFTKFILSGSCLEDENLICKVFENDYIAIETSSDIKGIEILSSIKNIVALASGIVEGLGFGENAHAIIITEGIKEMTKLALFYEIDSNTILSISGLGDLVLTASSKNSRNYITGKKVGEGMSPEKAIKTTKTIVEGVECAKAIHKLSKEHKIELPITKAIYNIFYRDKEVKKEILKIFR